MFKENTQDHKKLLVFEYFSHKSNQWILIIEQKNHLYIHIFFNQRSLELMLNLLIFN